MARRLLTDNRHGLKAHDSPAGWLVFTFLVPEIILVTIFTCWFQKYFWSPFSLFVTIFTCWSPFSIFGHNFHFLVTMDKIIRILAKLSTIEMQSIGKSLRGTFQSQHLRLLFTEQYTLHIHRQKSK